MTWKWKNESAKTRDKKCTFHKFSVISIKTKAIISLKEMLTGLQVNQLYVWLQKNKNKDSYEMLELYHPRSCQVYMIKNNFIILKIFYNILNSLGYSLKTYIVQFPHSTVLSVYRNISHTKIRVPLGIHKTGQAQWVRISNPP